MAEAAKTPVIRSIAEVGRLEHLSPEKDIEFAKRCADLLMDVVKKVGLSKKLGGDKEYLVFEAWLFVAQFYSTYQEIEWVREKLNAKGEVMGYDSRAVLKRNGEQIGATEAYCGRDEERWNMRPKYAWHYVCKDGSLSKEDPGPSRIVWEKNPGTGKNRPKKQKVEIDRELVPLSALKSMSQTRAQVKVLSARFRWVVVLAGFQPTPAEEMETIDEETGEILGSPGNGSSEPNGSPLCAGTSS